jgi:DNA polymerase III subunit delta'
MSWDILGHKWAVDLLKAHVVQGEVRHAYLFTGPQGVGRRTLALRLAQAINCITPPSPGEACQVCTVCTRIWRGLHPDLEIVSAEREGGIIKVDQIRELQHRLSLAPYEARYRVALLQRFEEANDSASNALLKTLEEPPQQVVIMLTAESSDRLLPTISSRCEVIQLRAVPPDILQEELQHTLGIAAEQAGVLANLSGGCPGYAKQLHEQPDRIEKRQIWLDDHHNLLSANLFTRFVYAYSISKDRENLRDFLHILLSFWRDVLLIATGVRTHLYNPDRLGEIENLATTLGMDTAHSVVAGIERTLRLLERNVNTRLAVEILFMEMPRT